MSVEIQRCWSVLLYSLAYFLYIMYSLTLIAAYMLIVRLLFVQHNVLLSCSLFIRGVRVPGTLPVPRRVLHYLAIPGPSRVLRYLTSTHVWPSYPLPGEIPYLVHHYYLLYCFEYNA